MRTLLLFLGIGCGLGAAAQPRAVALGTMGSYGWGYSAPEKGRTLWVEAIVRDVWPFGGWWSYARLLDYLDAEYQPVWLPVAYYRPRWGVGGLYEKAWSRKKPPAKSPLSVLTGVRIEGAVVRVHYSPERARRKQKPPLPDSADRYRTTIDLLVIGEQRLRWRVMRTDKRFFFVEGGVALYLYDRLTHSVPRVAEPVVRVGMGWNARRRRK